MEKADGPWALPNDLDVLHNAIIHYGVLVQRAAAAEFAKTANGPLSHRALENIHRTAILNHRAVRALCEMGWTPTAPTMIRPLLDLLVSTYAVASEPKDSEYRGFRYLAHSFIEVMLDPDSTAEQVKNETESLNDLKKQLPPADVTRADDVITAYKKKVPPFWYWPEIPNPGTAIKQHMPRDWDLWHQFCGSTHGSFIGSVLFDDFPDDPGIDPQEHPRNARRAIVASSRLLLDVSFARGQFEVAADESEYKHIVRTYIKPQQGLM